MTDQWYYWHDAEILGPFSGTELVVLAAAGAVLSTDTVWKGDNERGVPAHSVRHLFPAIPAGLSPAPAISSGGDVSPTTPTSDAAPDAATGGAPPVETAPSTPAAEVAAPWWGSAGGRPSGRGRAVAGKGAVLVGQDGTTVKYRMKCTTCGYEDRSWKTMPITQGTTRVTFYCPKCRRQRQVEINGYAG
jgi:hypothetical protein